MNHEQHSRNQPRFGGTPAADRCGIDRLGRIGIPDEAARRAGLLKHTHIEPGDGLWIVPCESVHSFFMKFTIDVLYLDRKHRVKKIRPEMAPWRVSACLTAHSVLELPAGTIARTRTQAGDQLEIKTLS